MTDNVIPETVPRGAIEIGGREFNVVATMGTAMRVRRELRARGINPDDQESVAKADPLEVQMVTLWSMIAHGDNADVSVDDLADMIPLDEFRDLMSSAEDVEKQSMPDDEPEGEAEARQAEKDQG